MCGIVGVLGDGDKASQIIDGLKLLEYRGYDSSGIAVVKSGKVICVKKKGKIFRIEKAVNGMDLVSTVGIGHTRWATHGYPSDINSHPHLDCRKQIAIVHNGIIENYLEIKEDLVKQGHKFLSDTDSEVIVHLIESFYEGDLLEATRRAVERLKGAYALCVMSSHHPNILIGVRKASPLVLGFGDGLYVFASDVTPILKFGRDVIYLEDGDIVEANLDSGYRIFSKGEIVQRDVVKINWNVSEAQKGGYPHYMLKEIHQQPEILRRLSELYIKGDKVAFGEIEKLNIDWDDLKKIYVVGCGTAYHAGLVGKYIFEKVCGVSVEIDVASEWRYRDFCVDKDSICIAISQSGETADTLSAVEKFREKGVKVVAVCNVVGSSLMRMADATILTHAGLEISVASTKAYTAQLFVVYLLAFMIANKRQIDISGYLGKMKVLPEVVEEILSKQKEYHLLAKRHHHFGSFLYLGRNLNYPTALEGALKLKEISYIPAEGYPAGEMKHGPIALIDEYRGVICIATDGRLYEKIYSNIAEIKARKGRLIVLATEGNDSIRKEVKEVLFVPEVDELLSPIVNIVPLQLFAYYVAVIRGCDIDQPRNLAKSVTVE